MELVPVKEHLEENKEFTDNPECQDSIYMSVDFYKKTGYNPPWICYYAKQDNMLVGCAAFKGKSINGKVEIAYAVFPQHQQKGIGTKIAGTLLQLALDTNPTITVTARTSPEENYSTKILVKNNFKFSGSIIDDEDGEIWEWEYEN